MSYFRLLTSPCAAFPRSPAPPWQRKPGGEVRSSMSSRDRPRRSSGSIAQIDVPAGYAFLDGKSTRAIMKSSGEPTSGHELGFLRPTNAHWSVLFEFSDIGYVKDDDKDKLDADKLLDSIKRGTAEANKERVRRRQRRRWRSSAGKCRRDTTPPRTTSNGPSAPRAKAGPILNYNTRLLGRKGVMEVVLIVEPDALPGDAADVQEAAGRLLLPNRQHLRRVRPATRWRSMAWPRSWSAAQRSARRSWACSRACWCSSRKVGR